MNGLRNAGPDSASASQQSTEERCARLGKRVEHGHPAPREAALKILGEQETAVVLGRHGQDQSVPHRQLVIDGQVQRGLEGEPDGVRDFKAVGPAQHRFARLRGGASGFARQNAGEFSEGLRRKHHPVAGQLLDQLHGRAAAPFISKPFGISQDIGVEGDSHRSGLIQLIACPVPCATGCLLAEPRQQVDLGSLAFDPAGMDRGDGGNSFATRQNRDDLASGDFAQQTGEVTIGVAGGDGFHRAPQYVVVNTTLASGRVRRQRGFPHEHDLTPFQPCWGV